MRYTLRSVGVYARHLRSNENARASNSGKFPLSSGDVGRTISRFEVGVLVFDVDRDLGGCRRTFRSAIAVLGLLFWDERSMRVCALGLLWVHTSNNLRWSVARARERDVARVRVSSRRCHDREVGSWQEGVRPRSGDVVTISNYPQGRTRGGRAHCGRDGIALQPKKLDIVNIDLVRATSAMVRDFGWTTQSFFFFSRTRSRMSSTVKVGAT